MGQGQSGPAGHAATPEQLSRQLAHRLADKCFTPLEITHFKDNFLALADEQDGLKFWKEDTLCQFLQLPDVLGANHIMGQMLGYLGAWPFSSLAPAILTREALCKIVALLTTRHERVLKGGRRDRAKLVFRSLAVHDRRMSMAEKPELHSHGDLEEDIRNAQLETPTHAAGFSVDRPGNDEDDEDDDEMALAALEALDAIEVFSLEKQDPHATEGKMRQAQIPFDNFRSLLLLLLLVAPLQPQEPLASLAERATDQTMPVIHQIADCILWSFSPEKQPGISYPAFKVIVNNSLPFLFDGFNPLFEHFLFSKHLDLSKRKRGSSSASRTSASSSKATIEAHDMPSFHPVLPTEGEILTGTVLCQISFFLPSSSLFHRLRLLYSGANDGFSINSFEQRVLNWRAPTILLVSGTRVAAESTSTLEDPADRPRGKFPLRRLPPGSSGNTSDNRLVFGAYITTPWKETTKSPAGDDQSLLFQLAPVHDVFRASSLNHDYATLTKSGIAFGSPVPRPKPVAGLEPTLSLGAVSLNLDENLEFGVFVHDNAGGGAYGTSKARGAGTSVIKGGSSSGFEERFDVECVEVWGCGGDEVAKEQADRWAWEEKEAAARRGVKLGKGERDADYALLEMAGLVGQGRSGGSMA